MFTQNANQWLHQVDPWTPREASDLLQALESGTSVGVFVCAATSDAASWYVMAPHAEEVLFLPSAAAWQALVAEVAQRYGLLRAAALPLGWRIEDRHGQQGSNASVVAKAVNDSKIMPLATVECANGGQ